MNQTMHNVYLHGHLAKHGVLFRLAVNNPVEAVRLLVYQLDGFAADLREGSYRLVRGEIDSGLEYGDEDLCFPFGKNACDFHIVPVLAGSKSGGFGKVILGAVILGAAVAGAMFTGGASLAGLSTGMSTSIIGGVTWGSVGMVGGLMMLGGVAQMLQPTVSTDTSLRETADQRPSFFLSGPVNMGEQGGAVPVLYGRFMCGSHVIGASVDVVDILSSGNSGVTPPVVISGISLYNASSKGGNLLVFKVQSENEAYLLKIKWSAILPTSKTDGKIAMIDLDKSLFVKYGISTVNNGNGTETISGNLFDLWDYTYIAQIRIPLMPYTSSSYGKQITVNISYPGGTISGNTTAIGVISKEDAPRS